MAAEVLAQFIQESGADGETAIRFIEAATDWPREMIEARLANHFKAHGRKTLFDLERTPHSWETELEELLCCCVGTTRAKVRAKLDSVTSDFTESSPSHSIAQKIVLCVLKLTGWSERRARFVVRQFVEFSQWHSFKRREYHRHLTIGKSLGWHDPGGNVTRRTPGTLVKNSTGEGPKRKHAHDRTPRTCFIPYSSTKHLNDKRASNIEPSSASVESEPADDQPLPLDLIREINTLSETYEEDTGSPPNAICIDPALVDGRETVLGLRVVPSYTGMQVAEIDDKP